MLRLMAEAADTPQELLPGMPLIEITGSGRVLIENHGGVTEYETDRIRVRLRFGAVVIRGSRLKITRMSKCQLVISGSLLGVDLERGAAVESIDPIFVWNRTGGTGECRPGGGAHIL